MSNIASRVCVATAIVAAMTGCGSSTDAASLATGTALVNRVAVAMKAFHADTGGWPVDNEAWYANAPPWDTTEAGTNNGEAGTRSDNTDTAMFSGPALDPYSHQHMPVCSGGTHTQPCWGGPYLTDSGVTALGQLLDPWGRPLSFEYWRPADGAGGSLSPQAPNGLIILWSNGPNMSDETGCLMGDCTLNPGNVAAGKPSVAGGDDIIVVLSTDSASLQ